MIHIITTIVEAVTQVIDTLFNIPHYLSDFIVLSNGLVPSFVLGIVISIMAISVAFLFAKIFQHLIEYIPSN